jgi:chemotaxis response regulator CheB
MNDISKIAVIGCSDEGFETATDIAGELKLGAKSSLIIIPHICSGRIYESLSDKRKKVYPILNNQIIEPQSIYVGLEYPTEYSYYGLRRELKIEKNRTYKFLLGKREIGYINRAFIAVADAFREKAIGVILYGIGGDGLDGIKRINAWGGITMTEKINNHRHFAEISTPFLAAKNCKMDYILSKEELGAKLEELLK